MDLKVDESFIKERISNKNKSRGTKGQSKKLEQQQKLELNENDQITVLDSVEAPEMTASQDS